MDAGLSTLLTRAEDGCETLLADMRNLVMAVFVQNKRLKAESLD